MTAKELKKLLLSRLEDAGLQRSGVVATRETDELLWIIEPDAPSRRPWVSLLVGCHLNGLGPTPLPRRPNMCHVYSSSEMLPLKPAGPPPPLLARFDDYRSFTVAVLDTTTELHDDERADALAPILDPLTELVHQTSTVADLRSADERGMFRAFYIDRDARALLDCAP